MRFAFSSMERVASRAMARMRCSRVGVAVPAVVVVVVVVDILLFRKGGVVGLLVGPAGCCGCACVRRELTRERHDDEVAVPVVHESTN